MTQPIFEKPGRILGAWFLVLVLLAAASAVYLGLLDEWVEEMREIHPWTYLQAADRLQSENDRAGALNMLEKAASLDEDSPVPHERAGIIYYQEQKWEEARRSYQTAIDLGSRSIGVRGQMFWSLMKLGRHLDAAHFGEQCIEEKLSSPDMLRDIGEAYRRARRFREAIPYYEKALAERPSEVLLMVNLREAYQATGQSERAAALQSRIEDAQGF